MSSEKPQSLRAAAQNRNLQTLYNFHAIRRCAALFPGKNSKQNKHINKQILFLALPQLLIPHSPFNVNIFDSSQIQTSLEEKTHQDNVCNLTRTSRLGIKQGKGKRDYRKKPCVKNGSFKSAPIESNKTPPKI